MGRDAFLGRDGERRIERKEGRQKRRCITVDRGGDESLRSRKMERMRNEKKDGVGPILPDAGPAPRPIRTKLKGANQCGGRCVFFIGGVGTSSLRWTMRVCFASFS